MAKLLSGGQRKTVSIYINSSASSHHVPRHTRRGPGARLSHPSCMRVYRLLRLREEAGSKAGVSMMSAPNKGVELTASSVRSCLAPASSRSSRLAFGFKDWAGALSLRDTHKSGRTMMDREDCVRRAAGLVSALQ